MAMLHAYAQLVRALPPAPTEVARTLLTHKTLEGALRGLLHHLSYLVCDATELPDGVAVDLLAALQRLHEHGDPSLLQGVGGREAAIDVAVLGNAYQIDTLALVHALWPQIDWAEWCAVALAALSTAVDRFFQVPWTDGVRRMRRAAILAQAMLATVPSASSPSSLDGPAWGSVLGRAYHHQLAARRIPPDEASSSASPWPTAWLAAKVECLTLADEVLLRTPTAEAGPVLQAMSTGAVEVPDAVALVDVPLVADLQTASPRATHIVDARPAPFPGMAWAAVRQALAPATQVDSAVVDMVLAILPHLARPTVEARLAKPRYQGMSQEAVMEAFLDDPEGLRDLEDDYDPCAVPDRDPAEREADAPLSSELKQAILAAAEATDSLEEEWDIGTELTPALRAERILLQAYLHDTSVFARSKSARASPLRTQLRDSLASLGAWGDDQIEGWAVMLERNPRKEDMLAQAQRMVAPNVNQGTQSSWGPDKLKGGRVPSAPRGGRRGRGRAPGRGRGRGH
ncbi:hypothetical protein MCAP1_002137 [Malassezia caprae]|uniref:Uncharacterized protein n=1 Tax=Malassezia caprae TaxID=1381934 RepID=A0AAF0IVQ9_9BASI|nr:hypothetical protein MCAP1_002137 [Malassezia caprae]